jgi:CheY-like chemotaxis protein
MNQEKILHILLVDDDEVDVMNVQRAFKKNNIANPLYVARNGLEALEMLRGQNGAAIPTERRLILLDLNMPKMNGLEFLRELRADPQLRSLTVVVLTTSDDDRDKVEAYELNVAGYILKPVTFTAFVEAMAALNKYWTISEILERGAGHGRAARHPHHRRRYSRPHGRATGAAFGRRAWRGGGGRYQRRGVRPA